AYDPASGGTPFTPADTDKDGIPDYLDRDSDNDGVPDYIEGHDADANGKPDTKAIGRDKDKDGLDDAFDIYDRSFQPLGSENAIGSNAPLQDFDGDGIRDWRDVDDDEDGIPTRDEDLNNDGDWSNDDRDLDGHPEYLDISTECTLFIPEGFSPNGDGIHDFFQIHCIEMYPNARLYIFNRWGNKLYEKQHYGNLDVWGSDQEAWWWGTSDNKWTLGRPTLPAGTYIYVLELGNGKTHKGTVMISY
ncbi:MAG TPA: gliding motility-associated C-terminal domain-containing protein, partial [Prolixibacteraceae bacterium]|nr:gliding motility-associated C-terminal domain-containing protein [Prolixibacteraceae bacterium]